MDWINDELRDVRAQLNAHFTVLACLSVKRGADDPTFEDFVRSKVDTVLGKHLAESGGVPSELHGKIRRYVMEIIENAKVSELEPQSPKRLTVRRRFLNWLERG